MIPFGGEHSKKALPYAMELAACFCCPFAARQANAILNQTPISIGVRSSLMLIDAD
jgi:hypothetical protein